MDSSTRNTSHKAGVSRTHRAGRAILLLALMLAALFSVSVPVSAQQADSRLAGQLIINSTQDKVEVSAKRPWTKDELTAAVSLDIAAPLKVPTAAERASALASISAAGSAAEPSGVVLGGAPDSQAGVPVMDAAAVPAAANATLASELAALKGTDAQASAAGADGVAPQVIAGPQGYPGAYTRYEVFTGVAHPRTYALYPYSTLGKLFFRQRDTDGIIKSFVCSASVIANGSIMTAGHCLHAGRFGAAGWSTNVVFVPAYKDGFAPLGQWTPRFLRIFTAWYLNRSLARDVGGAPLNRDSLGRQVSQITGWLGFAWNWGYNQHYNAFGYPAQTPFNGLRLQTCEASLAYYDTAYVPATKAIGCDMNGGSSGGAWIMGFGTGNWLIGVNSYKRIINGVILSQEMFSPHFDTTVKTAIWDCLALNIGC